MRSASQREPNSEVTAAVSAFSPRNARNRPKRPSTAVRGPVMPRAASWAAVTPARAAQPQWSRLTVPPARLASMIPLAMLQATPMASAMRSASSSSRRAAAAADPTAPQIEVACWPRSKYTDWRARGS